jgi:hypothetical protein
MVELTGPLCRLGVAEKGNESLPRATPLLGFCGLIVALMRINRV